MNDQVQAKYSVLIAGGEFSIDDIRNLLQDGLKVIWFTDSDKEQKAKESLCDFKKAGFLELYINNNNAHYIIEDGADSDDMQEILTALEEGDVRFNREQYDIEHQPLDRNIIIEAGAGTGKTHVMINRIMFLLHMDPEFDFSKVAMITFTNKATDNMRLRLIKTLDLKYKLTGKLKYVDRIEQLSQISISTVIEEMKEVSKWSMEEIEKICCIARNNIQVSLVLKEPMVSGFYKKLIKRKNCNGKNIKWVKKTLKRTDEF